MWRSMSKKLEWLLIVVVLAATTMLGGCGDGGQNDYPVSINFVYPESSSLYGRSSSGDVYVGLNGSIAQFRSDTTYYLDGDETWEITQYPGSVAPTFTSINSIQSETNTSSMSFTPTQVGKYLIVFSFSDFGKIRSATMELNVVDADAGPDQIASIGDRVELEGSSSLYSRQDSEYVRLLFTEWSPISYPAADRPVIEGTFFRNSDQYDVRNWYFHPHSAGLYVLKLTLYGQSPSCMGISNCGNNFRETLSEDTVTIAVDLTIPPVAAISSRPVAVGDTVSLSGSASSDAYGLPLTYSWSITSKPVGSNASLTNATTVNPSFTADVAGDYVISLTVDNGYLSSTPASATITASPSVLPNTAPVANAGPDQSVTVGNLITLDGSACSDADGDTITYSWGIISAPGGSTAGLNNGTSVSPTFTPDLAGDYVIDLDVYDGITWSQIDTVTVTAADSSGSITTVPALENALANNTFLIEHATAPNGLLELYEFGSPGPGGSLFFAYISPMSAPSSHTREWSVADKGTYIQASETSPFFAMNTAAPVNATDILTMTGYAGTNGNLGGSSVESWVKVATLTAADFTGKTMVLYATSYRYVFSTATTGQYTDGNGNTQSFTWGIDSGGHKAVVTFSNGFTHSLYLTVRGASNATMPEMAVVSAANDGTVTGGSLQNWMW